MNRNIICMAVTAWLMTFLFGQSANFTAGWLLCLHPLTAICLAGAAIWMNRSAFDTRTAQLRILIWFLICFATTLVVELFQRSLGTGNAWEIVTFFALANWTISLATMSQNRLLENITAVLSGATVFFILAMAQGWQFYALGVVYGICLIWWSMTSYWKTLDQKYADEHKTQLSTKGIVLFVSIAAIAATCGIAALIVSTQKTEIAGFSWFSGGVKWSDDYARDGIGDGNMIRAAMDNAGSFGPVDSDVFLESDKPTLFDVASDMYGKPKKKRKFNRAISVGAENFRHNHQKIARNQRASAEFSTQRITNSRRPAAQDDHLSNAMFFYKGSVPSLLAVETYNTYDDGFWLHIDPSQIGDETPSETLPDEKDEPLPPGRTVTPVSHTKRATRKYNDPSQVQLTPRFGKPWMTLEKFPGQSIYTGWEYSAVKVINFRSTRIPSTPCLEQFYIDKVDRANFFKRESDGIARLDNDSPHIPEMTIVHQLSKGINLFQAKVNPQKLTEQLNLKRNQLKRYLDQDAINQPVRSTADKWCRDLTADWQKVDAIIGNLRNQFVHQPDAVISEHHNDVSTQLLSTGGGTDYMFATTAALMLRSQNIPARVVSGFFVSPDRFDHHSGHTTVLPSDIHVWAEVSLDGKHWIPIEPTPGYPIPKYELSWMQRIQLAWIDTMKWIAANPPVVLAIVVFVTVGIYYWKSLANAFYTLRWSIITRLFPKRAFLETANLIEKRSQLAGIPRPSSTSIASHSCRLARYLTNEDTQLDLLSRFTQSLNRFLYHPNASSQLNQQLELDQKSCFAIQRQFGFVRLKQVASSKLRGDTP